MVVDAGCGNGRWTYGLLRLGCRVVASDYTTSGCEETRKNTEQFNDFVDVVAADIFHMPLRKGVFDIVFCWGVLHHTGNLESAFQNVASLLKPGVLLHIYVYGRKSWRVKFWRKILSQFAYNNRVVLIRFLTGFTNRFPKLRVAIPFSPSIHSTFDAYSPSINEESTEEQIVSLFTENDFKSFRRLMPRWYNAAFSPDIHMHGEKNV